MKVNNFNFNVILLMLTGNLFFCTTKKLKCNFLIIFCLFNCVVNAQMANEKTVTWDYPINLGSDGWNQCNSPSEIYEKLNIPEDVLMKLDTESLVQICLDYPAVSIFFVTNTPQQGFDGFFVQFNGIRELMSRNDVGHFLLRKYSSMTLNDFNPLWTLENQGDFTLKFYYMELFLVQQQSLQSMDVSERKLLLKESMRKYELKKSRSDLFGGNSLVMSTWILAKTLHVENKLKTNFSDLSNVEYSLNTGVIIDFDVPSVFQQAKKYSDE